MATSFDWSTPARRDDFLTSLAGLARQLTNASAIAFFRADTGPELYTGPQVTAPDRDPRVYDMQRHLESAENARRQQCLVRHRSAPDRTILLLPYAATRGQTEVLGAELRQSAQAIETAVLVLQLMAGHVALWDERHRANDLDHEAAATAAILELIGKTARVEGLGPAAEFLVNAVRSHLGCEQVALGTANPAHDSTAGSRPFQAVSASIRDRNRPAYSMPP